MIVTVVLIIMINFSPLLSQPKMVLLGAAGISAFPMAGRLVAQIAQEEDFDNYLLMHAIGANIVGQLGSVMAGGILLALVSGLV